MTWLWPFNKLAKRNNHPEVEQVDILISKNQALQILYPKHCVYETT